MRPGPAYRAVATWMRTLFNSLFGHRNPSFSAEKHTLAVPKINPFGIPLGG